MTTKRWSMFKVGIILPSRGMMFSQTAEDILTNVKKVPHKWFFAHKRPLPQCFEEPTRVALADETITHLWFVEDDMILPPDTLKTLLRADEDAISADYPIGKEGQGAIFTDKEGRVVFTGTGCLLVKREVFKKLPKPYFTDKIKWNALNYGTHITMIANGTGKKESLYGLHDVTFGVRLYSKGTPIVDSGLKIGQHKLIKLGEAGTNEGAHQIEDWTKVSKNYLQKKLYSSEPMPTGKLVWVTTPTGDISVSESHAKTLIKAGLAKKPEKRSVIIDWNGFK